jgi:hypothetical protein
MMMRNSEFLRQQAETCIALSRATFDLTVAGRLRTMAAEFQVQASEHDGDGFPRWTGPTATAKSKSDRH